MQIPGAVFAHGPENRFLAPPPSSWFERCSNRSIYAYTQLYPGLHTRPAVAMRLNSYPTCDLGLLIRGITFSIGIPYEINVRIDYM